MSDGQPGVSGGQPPSSHAPAVGAGTGGMEADTGTTASSSPPNPASSGAAAGGETEGVGKGGGLNTKKTLILPISKSQ
jgi:hypothetical protein